jgi:CDGSH-type Zn-finger protein
MADTPRIARRGPFPVEVTAGKTYWWCACGLSARQPFCDGSHKGTGIEPVAHTAEKDGALWFCGCKATGRAPLCDGSHSAL